MHTIGPSGLTFALRASLCLLLVAGCGGGGGGSGGGNNQPGDEEPPPTSVIRLINAIPDAPALLLDLDGVFIGSAPFGESSSGSETERSGDIEFDIVYRTASEESELVVEAFTTDIGTEREVYLVLSGEVAAPLVNVIDNPKVVAQTDGDGNTVPATTLGVQFVQSADLGGDLDIYLSDFGDPISALTPTGTLGFAEISEQVTVDAGDGYQVRVTRAGETTPIYDSGEITLDAGRNQIFLMIDYFGPGDSLLRVVPIANGAEGTLENAALPGELRLANFIANSAQIDLYLDDTNDAPEIDNVPFGAFSEYRALDAGRYAINVTPENDNITFLFERNFSLQPGESRSLILSGDSTLTDAVAGIFVLESKRPIATELRIRFVHAAMDAGDVDLYVLQPGEAVEDATPKLAGAAYLFSGAVGVEVGTYDLIVTVAGESTVIAGPLRQSVEVAAYSAVLGVSPTGGEPYELTVREDAVQ